MCDYSKKNILSYYSGFIKSPQTMSSIIPFDRDVIISLMNNMDKRKGLDLILHTPGGRIDITESIEKLMAFGKDTGFEITTKATDSDGTDYTYVLGMKGNIWWLIDESGGSGYQLNGDKCAMLTYDVENQTWSTLIANVGETQFKAMFESLTSYLYKSNAYFANEGFTSNGEGTYARRDVLKFKYHRAVGTVSVDHEYYVDKDLGISIYQYAETRNGSEVSWAKLETTSFKTGNDVEAIVVS